MIGTGIASGANRAEEAASLAVNSRFLDDINIKDAKGLLINITASSKLGINEYVKACEHICSSAADDATIITGRVVDDSLGEKIKITVFASGLVSNSFKLQEQPMEKLEESGDLLEVFDEGQLKKYLDIPTFLRKNGDKLIKY